MHTRSMFASWCLLAAALASPCVSAAKHDVDGDGRDDVFWRNARTGANALWPSGNPTLQRNLLGVTNTRWAVVGFGDFDGDGFADLLWRERSTGANRIWRSANGATQLALTAVPNLDWFVAGVGDFDRDGHSDILWRNRRTGANVVWPWAQSTRLRQLAPVATSWVVAGIGDFDGDGGDDIFWRNIANGANALWLSNGGRVPLTTVADQHWQVDGVGDFDGDGNDDVFWRTSWDGRNVIWRSAQSTMQQGVYPVLAPVFDVAAIGDFDGDDRADVFWRDFDAGSNTVWRAANSDTERQLTAVRDMAWAIAPYGGQPTLPSATFDSVTVPESNSGAFPVRIRAHLAYPSVEAVHVYVQFDDTSGPTGARRHSDFDTTPEIQDVAIPPGEDTGSLLVWVRGDTTPEANEAVHVGSIASPTARFVNLPALVITNDDANTIWVDNTFTYEGDAGMHPMSFTVRLSRPQATPVRFDITTQDLPSIFAANAGEDYVETRAYGVVIPAGATSTKFVVQVIDDTTTEYYDEAFEVILYNVVGATNVNIKARGHIYDFQEGFP